MLTESQIPSANQPSEYSDVGTVAKLALTVTLTLAIAFFGVAVALPDDHWVKDSLVNWCVALSVAFAIALFSELQRQSKRCHMSWHILMGIQYAALLCATGGLIFVAAALHGSQHYLASDLHKARKAELKCLTNLRSELDQLLAQRQATSDALLDCLKATNQQKRLSSDETYCGRERVAWERMKGRWEAARSKSCSADTKQE